MEISACRGSTSESSSALRIYCQGSAGRYHGSDDSHESRYMGSCDSHKEVVPEVLSSRNIEGRSHVSSIVYQSRRVQMRTSFFKYRLPISLFVIVLLLTGCAPVTANSSDVLQSKLERVSNPQIDPPDQAGLANGNTAFALDLAQRLRSPDGNQFYSPYSISEALAMVYAGAQGRTMAPSLWITPPSRSLWTVIFSTPIARRAIGRRRCAPPPRASIP